MILPKDILNLLIIGGVHSTTTTKTARHARQRVFLDMEPSPPGVLRLVRKLQPPQFGQRARSMKTIGLGWRLGGLVLLAFILDIPSRVVIIS